MTLDSKEPSAATKEDTVTATATGCEDTATATSTHATASATASATVINKQLLSNSGFPSDVAQSLAEKPVQLFNNEFPGMFYWWQESFIPAFMVQRQTIVGIFC